MSGPSPKQPTETPRAAQAFADYVALGPGRSLVKLCEKYREQSGNKAGTEPPTVRFSTLADWSSKFRWQERLQTAISEKVEASLRDAAEIDADSFFKSSVQLNKEITKTVRTNTADLRNVISIRESVRRPVSKGSTSVSVNLSVEVRQAAERLAQELGIEVDELMAEAEDVARIAWSKPQ